MVRVKHAAFALIVAGVVFAFAARFYPQPASGRATDFYTAICGARALLQGVDPYNGACTPVQLTVAYPLTAYVAAIPSLTFSPHADAAISAFAVGLLVYAILRTGQRWRFLVFVSPVFTQAFAIGQWSPLLLAVALWPALLPLTLLKPQIGLPIALTRLTRRRALACLAFIALTLLIRPDWPFRWFGQAIHNYTGFIPLLVLPLGPLLLLGLFHWRDDRVRLLLLTAAVPQHLRYDALALWSLPQTRRQMLVLCTVSWLPEVAFLTLHPPAYVHQLATVACVYLPALAIVLPSFGGHLNNALSFRSLAGRMRAGQDTMPGDSGDGPG